MRKIPHLLDVGFHPTSRSSSMIALLDSYYATFP